MITLLNMKAMMEAGRVRGVRLQAEQAEYEEEPAEVLLSQAPTVGTGTTSRFF